MALPTKKTTKSPSRVTVKPTKKPTATASKKPAKKPATPAKKPAANTNPPGFYDSAYKKPTGPTYTAFDDSKYVAPTQAERETYTDKSMADLSAQFGFKTDQGWFEDLARQQADIVKGAVTAEQVKTQKGLNQANTLIDSTFFQEGLKTSQGIADRGLNAGMATEQNTRLAMGRQAAMGQAYADAQGQMFQLGQQKIAADKQASIDALTNWQDAVWKGAAFTQEYNRDQYGRVQDTNAWNMQNYTNQLNQYNQDRQFGYQQNQDKNAWNMESYTNQLNQYNTDRQFGYDKAIDARNYSRQKFESDRDYSRNKFESDRSYNWDVKSYNSDMKQRQFEFNKNYGLDAGKLQLDKDRFAFEKIQASKVGSGGGGGGGRSYSSGRSSSGGSKSSGGSSGGGGSTSTVRTGSTGTGVVNMQKELAAQRSTSGASKGTQILIGKVQASQKRQTAQKSLGITAPHLTGVIKPSPKKTTSSNKYANLAKGRLW